MKLSRLCKKFPCTGIKNWALLCSLTFIVAQMFWYLSSFVRRYDLLEIPMVILFFPPAPLIDPHNGLLRDDNLYLYALIYWASVFFLSWVLSRRKINPVIPAIAILLLSCMPCLIYFLYLLWQGPVYF